MDKMQIPLLKNPGSPVQCLPVDSGREIDNCSDAVSSSQGSGASLKHHGDLSALRKTDCPIIYFSSASNNTHRFVLKLQKSFNNSEPSDIEDRDYIDKTGHEFFHKNESLASGSTQRFAAQRLPLRVAEETVLATKPFVLMSPTYGGIENGQNVPKQVIKFLNVEQNRNLLQGVIAAGNSNFGQTYCITGDIISHKCQVPYLYKFELMGTPSDVQTVHEKLEKLWKQQ